MGLEDGTLFAPLKEWCEEMEFHGTTRSIMGGELKVLQERIVDRSKNDFGTVENQIKTRLVMIEGFDHKEKLGDLMWGKWLIES